MENRMRKLAVVAASVVALAACTQGPSAETQTPLGGTKQTAVTLSEIVKPLDNADRQAMQQATQGTLERTPSGQPSTWSNPDSGHSGTVTPVRTYRTSTGQYCREFQQTVTISGQTQQAYGTACRQPDGTWRIQGS
jgi:surface antigen